MTIPIRTLCVGGLACLVAAGAIRANVEPGGRPEFVIKTNPVVLANGATSEILLVEGTNLQPVNDGDDKRLVVEDLGQGSSAIKITFSDAVYEFVSSDGAHYWRVTLEAEGLPVESELSRIAGLTYGDNKGVAEYVISTKSEGTPSWTITPPKKQLRIQQTSEITFAVKTGDQPVRLSLAGSSLQDAATLAWLENASLGLRLAKPGEREGRKPDDERQEDERDAPPRSIVVDLPANATTNVVLEIDCELPAGRYTGAVSLTAVGSPETQSFDLEVFSSPPWRRAWGGFWIALGIALSFFVTVAARSWSKRLQSMRAAGLVAAGLDPLQEKLEAVSQQTKHDLPRLGGAIADLLAELGEEKLGAGGYLPPRVPISFTGDEERTEAFKTHLKALSDRAQVLDEIVRTGVETVAERWDPARAADYARVLDDLDQLADKATLESVATDVATALRGLPEVPGTEAVGEPKPRPSVRQLQLRLDYLHGSIWFIWVAITLAGGVGVLILPNAGFGTPMDLLTCFFWGLGVQTAGDGLQQVTPGSVKSTLELTAPPIVT